MSNQLPRLTGSDENIASTRTTVNTAVIAVIVMLANQIFGWELTVEQLLPFMPVIVPAYFFVVRVSYYLAERFPTLGRVLFGITAKPLYIDA